MSIPCTDNKRNILLLLFTIYSLTIFVYRDFGIPTAAGYLLLIVGLICCVAGGENVKLSANDTSAAFLVLFLFQIIEILRSIILGNSNQLMYIPAFALVSVYVLMSNADSKTLFMAYRLWMY